MTQPTSKEINALLPCPFCGSPAKIERAGTMRRSNIVICTNCGARLESGDVLIQRQVGTVAASSALTRPAMSGLPKGSR